MKKDIDELRYDLLLETVKHYNSNNRCNNAGGCTYTPMTIGLTYDHTEGCAIGRKLSKRMAKKFDKLVSTKEIGGSIDSNTLFILLPKRLQKLGQSFLLSLQSLHDNSRYWDVNGITNAGMDYVAYMVKTFWLKPITKDLI